LYSSGVALTASDGFKRDAFESYLVKPVFAPSPVAFTAPGLSVKGVLLFLNVEFNVDSTFFIVEFKSFTGVLSLLLPRAVYAPSRPTPLIGAAVLDEEPALTPAEV